MTSLDPSITAQTDLYGLLGISPDSKETEIRRAYRKVALIYHPDKNPTEEARQKFHELNIALETLVSTELRLNYDQLRKAWIEKETRKRELNENRRKLQQDLEDREKQALVATANALDARRKRELLKMEGLQRRKTHEENLKKRRTTTLGNQNEETKENETKAADVTNGGGSSTISDKNDSSNGTVKVRIRSSNAWEISEQQLSRLFSRFGFVEHVVILPSAQGKKYISALVVFYNCADAQVCVSEDYSRLDDFKMVKSAVLLNPRNKMVDENESQLEDSKVETSSKQFPVIDRNSENYAEATMLRLKLLSKT